MGWLSYITVDKTKQRISLQCSSPHSASLLQGASSKCGSLQSEETQDNFLTSCCKSTDTQFFLSHSDISQWQQQLRWTAPELFMSSFPLTCHPSLTVTLWRSSTQKECFSFPLINRHFRIFKLSFNCPNYLLHRTWGPRGDSRLVVWWQKLCALYYGNVRLSKPAPCNLCTQSALNSFEMLL